MTYFRALCAGLGLGVLLTGPVPGLAQTPAEVLRSMARSLTGQPQETTRQQPRRVVNQRVLDTQRHLNTLGYDTGTPDGVTGARTRAAITAYQQDRGYSPTGQLTDPQFAELAREAQNSPAGQPGDPTQGQTLLAQLGYDIGVIDGKWGQRSQRALDAFRREAGRPEGRRLTQEDILLLTERAAPQPQTPTTPGTVFDTVVLYGNTFSLSQPFLEMTELTWADVKPAIFDALPEASRSTLPPAEAQARVEAKSEEVTVAFTQRVEALHNLMRPYIQQRVAATTAPQNVEGIVANYDIEIAGYFLAGKGRDMIADFELQLPGIEVVIDQGQSLARQMQALGAVTENTLSVTPGVLQAAPAPATAPAAPGFFAQPDPGAVPAEQPPTPSFFSAETGAQEENATEAPSFFAQPTETTPQQ